MPETHHLDQNAIVYLWDRDAPPALTVDPGDTVVFETPEITRGQITPQSTAEALLSLAPAEPKLSEAIDALLDGGGGRPISGAGNLKPPSDSACFSFLVEGTDPRIAREDLAEAVALLVEKPALEAAIVAATARFETDPEGAFAEQQRLRQRKLEIESRLGQMARQRAAAVASGEHSVPAEGLREDEQETG